MVGCVVDQRSYECFEFWKHIGLVRELTWNGGGL
jgi:hypothetical protein